uniref:Uncharacterized protein n=1 Tax=uncultured marine virus TaxID=186617 RepID=A0A0F7L5L6_9VIRU|nr:hypothetical protein [uncultured marine virus]
MTILNKIIGGVAILALVLSIVGLVGNKQPILKFGAAPATSYSSLGVGTLYVGSGCTDSFSTTCTTTGTSITSFGQLILSNELATTSTGNMTLAANDLMFPTMLMTPNLAALTVTLPTATTLGATYLPNTGDRVRILIVNSTTTAAAIITLAGNTGMTLANASTSAKIIPGGVGLLDIVRTGASSFVASLVPTI